MLLQVSKSFHIISCNEQDPYLKSLQNLDMIYNQSMACISSMLFIWLIKLLSEVIELFNLEQLMYSVFFIFPLMKCKKWVVIVK